MIIPIIALIVALTGGTAFASTNALPGDTLYRVKVAVVEPVRVALAVTDIAEAEVQANLAAERLEEATTLESRGTLTVEVRERLAERFAQHEQKAEARIAKLEAKGRTEAAAAVSAALEEQLRANVAVLTALDAAAAAQAAGDHGATADALAVAVQARADALAAKRAREAARVERAPATESQHAAAGRKGAAEKKIAEVAQFLGRTADRGRVDAAVVASAVAKLDAARALVVEGDAAVTAGEFGTAFVKFGAALHAAQNAKTFVHLAEKEHLPEKIRERLGIPPANDDDDADAAASEQDGTEAPAANKADDDAASRGKQEDRDERPSNENRGKARSADVRADAAVKSAIEVVVPTLP